MLHPRRKFFLSLLLFLLCYLVAMIPSDMLILLGSWSEIIKELMIKITVTEHEIPWQKNACVFFFLDFSYSLLFSDVLLLFVEFKSTWHTQPILSIRIFLINLSSFISIAVVAVSSEWIVKDESLNTIVSHCLPFRFLVGMRVHWLKKSVKESFFSLGNYTVLFFLSFFQTFFRLVEYYPP